ARRRRGPCPSRRPALRLRSAGRPLAARGGPIGQLLRGLPRLPPGLPARTDGRGGDALGPAVLHRRASVESPPARGVAAGTARRAAGRAGTLRAVPADPRAADRGRGDLLSPGRAERPDRSHLHTRLPCRCQRTPRWIPPSALAGASAVREPAQADRALPRGGAGP